MFELAFELGLVILFIMSLTIRQSVSFIDTLQIGYSEFSGDVLVV